MSQREELLDMAVHALTPLMKGRPDASPDDLFDAAMEIGEKLIAKVDATVASDAGAPPRDELMDMGVHALSALLNGRQPASADDVLDECMAVARSLIAKVDEALAQHGSADREEMLDVAVHAQTAFLNSRPKMDADQLSDECIRVAKRMIARVDGKRAT